VELNRMKLVPENYPHAECAKDLEAGANHFGNLGDHTADATLAKGGVVMLFCPACTAAGRPHMLSVKKENGRFVCEASGGADMQP
jgi:hypothetical protein